MISLFIDTSSSDVSIAVLKDNKLLSKVVNNIPNKHSVYTVSYIKDAIEKAKIKKEDVNKIFVVNGPGSFTGIRIGLTIAKIYSYLLNVPVVPVSSLKSLYLSVSSNLVLSVIKANASSYYVSLYKDDEEILEEKFCSKEELINIINVYNPHIVSNDNIVINDIEVKKVNLDFENIINYYKDKKEENSYSLKPNYLKLPQALESKK